MIQATGVLDELGPFLSMCIHKCKCSHHVPKNFMNTSRREEKHDCGSLTQQIHLYVSHLFVPAHVSSESCLMHCSARARTYPMKTFLSRHSVQTPSLHVVPAHRQDAWQALTVTFIPHAHCVCTHMFHYVFTSTAFTFDIRVKGMRQCFRKDVCAC
jgi:hypothetical protein